MIKKQHSKTAASQTDDGLSCPFRLAPCLPRPERLVGLGFRYWMRGRLEGTVNHWERAWNLYAGSIGRVGASVLVSSLSRWVCAIDNSCARKIDVYPEDGRSFCRDECIAVSIIAACQHKTCPALRACAFALVETSSIDNVVDETQNFADAMTSFKQVLSPRSIVTDPVSSGAAGTRQLQ